MRAGDKSQAVDCELIEWLRPILDRIVADGRQLTRAEFTDMVRKKFNRDARASEIDRAWEATAQPKWREVGGGTIPEAKRVADWNTYLKPKAKE
jgi:hypothetical protein